MISTNYTEQSPNIFIFDRDEGIDNKLVKITDNLYQGSRGVGFNDKILDIFQVEIVLALTTVEIPNIKKPRLNIRIEDGQTWSYQIVSEVLEFFQQNKDKKVLVH